MFRSTLLFTMMIAAAMMFACEDKSDKGNNTTGSGTNGGTTGNPDAVLVFTAIPDQNSSELEAKFKPVADYLAEKLGVKVEYKPVTNYAASVEAFKNGDVQLAWFGGLTGVQAMQFVPGARAIAQGEEDPKYVSYFIAHKSTGLTKSDDFPEAIKDFGFTFGSESSTSGRLMPSYFIEQITGKKPEAFFAKKPAFSGSHDKTVDAVLAGGDIKVGVLSYKVYEKRVAADPSVQETAPVIWVTPTYADYNLTAHPMLESEEMFGPGFIDKLQTALIEMKDEKLLAAFQRKSLIEAKNEDFEGVKVIAQELGFLD